MSDTLPNDMQPCGECGMLCSPSEYHPFAACLMFKGCHDGDMVRANVQPMWVRDGGETVAETLAKWPMGKPLPERAALNMDVLCQELTHYVTEVPIKDTMAKDYFRNALVAILPKLDKVPYDLVRIGTIEPFDEQVCHVKIDPRVGTILGKSQALFAAVKVTDENAAQS